MIRRAGGLESTLARDGGGGGDYDGNGCSHRGVSWWMRLSCCVLLVPAPGAGGMRRDESKLG